MLDPTCPDITGRVLECLCRHGLAGYEAVRRGVSYLLGVQEKNGSWYGRWGVNYIYGTFLALRGLAATGAPAVQEAITRGADWLCAVQNSDGGWGESCASYARNRFLPAASCASQTAWAVLGLLAAGRNGAAARRGIRFLLERQRDDGTWAEEASTGTGFPNVFYMVYGMYRDYFPLLALTQFK
jgi:squalene-hopene/tetraprenyl-beta-curcumene cyclase